jgi:hypothetical protein
VEILAVDGRRIRTLALEGFGPGGYEIGWDGRDATGARIRSGHYYIVARGGSGQVAVRQVTLVGD